jgi:hypothetical protein
MVALVRLVMRSVKQVIPTSPPTLFCRKSRARRAETDSHSPPNCGPEFAGKSQSMACSTYVAIQSMAITQFCMWPRLGNVQQGIFNQAVKAIGDQLQLVSRVTDPREFASAQADLVKGHGQHYIDIITKAVDLVAETWHAWGNRFENTMNAAADKARASAEQENPSYAIAGFRARRQCRRLHRAAIDGRAQRLIPSPRNCKLPSGDPENVFAPSL